MAGIVNNAQSISQRIGAVTDPSTGTRYFLMKFAEEVEIVAAYALVSTTIGAGTIALSLEDRGTSGTATAGTAGTLGTAVGITANIPTLFGAVEYTMNRNDVLELIVKGDGTLDLAGLVMQIDYVYGMPAAETR